MKGQRLTQEEVKAAADRAQARSQRGSKAEDVVNAALTEGELNAEIQKLAELPVSVYESKRVAEAKRLSMRAGVLDKLVASARPKEDKEQGRTISLLDREPASEKVDGSALLGDIIKQITRFIFITEHEKLAVALWAIGSYAFDAFFIFPRLRLKSATKGCGKSTLLDLLECLVNRPLVPSDITGPALFRVISAQRPTMLLDEADRYMKNDQNLAAAVNAGHKKKRQFNPLRRR